MQVKPFSPVRPIDTLFGPRDRCMSFSAFAESYLSFKVQVLKKTSKQLFKAKLRYLWMVRRSFGPNKHVQATQRAQDLVSIEHEGANQGDGV
jgi:hypothetical protein